MFKPNFMALLLLITTCNLVLSQNVGIGTLVPASSALLDLSPPNNDKGLLIPRLKTSERDVIVNPAESLLIFNTDTQCYEGYSEQKSIWLSIGCLELEDFACGKYFTDNRDGYIYKTTRIGDLCWIAENLKYLPQVFSGNSSSASDSRYYVYGYSGTNVATAKSQPNYIAYGVLYNWFAATQDACPNGWRLPTDVEWCAMENFLEPGIDVSCSLLDGYRGTLAQLLLKDNVSWNGSNSSGFTALPGGSRTINNQFNDIGTRGLWWTGTENGSSVLDAFYRRVHSSDTGVYRAVYSKESGFSVRCVQD